MSATEYRNAPAVLVTPRGATQEVSAPMCDHSIPSEATASNSFTCEHCHQAFTPKDPRPRRPHRFCSRECTDGYWRARRTRVCEQCGCKFDTGRARSSSGPHKLRFCGSRCYGVWQRDRASLNGTYHRKVRLEVLDRDGHKCRVCGADDHLHVHHIEPYAEGQADPHRPSNLVTLCYSCHQHTHSFLDGSRPSGPYWQWPDATCPKAKDFKR